MPKKMIRRKIYSQTKDRKNDLHLNRLSGQSDDQPSSYWQKHDQKMTNDDGANLAHSTTQYKFFLIFLHYIIIIIISL